MYVALYAFVAEFMKLNTKEYNANESNTTKRRRYLAKESERVVNAMSKDWSNQDEHLIALRTVDKIVERIEEAH